MTFHRLFLALSSWLLGTAFLLLLVGNAMSGGTAEDLATAQQEAAYSIGLVIGSNCTLDIVQGHKVSSRFCAASDLPYTEVHKRYRAGYYK